MAEKPKSWQSRIAEATDALAQDFVESVSYDWRLYRQDIAGSIAHATMLAKVGLISEQDREAIVSGLKQIESEIDSHGHKWPGFKKELEDIHMCVESALIERIGEPGRRLHTGRSRNDQVASDLAHWIEENAAALDEKMRSMLIRALVDLAMRSVDVVMPSYTHLQRAQPISAAAESLAWATMFDYDAGRFRTPLAMFLAPLGSGAIAGTSLPIDTWETQMLLGKQQVSRGNPDPEFLRQWEKDARERNVLHDFPLPTSSIEHTASRDGAVEFLFTCAMTAMHLSRWAEQWIIYSSQEFGFIRTADRYTTGSSMMPQKRNPDMLELIRGRCGGVYGNLVALLTICKGLPIGYNRDLQEDKRHVFAAYDTVSSCLTMAAAIVNATEFVKERCEAACEEGFMDATSLAEYLVVKGLPFRTAHQVVGSLVRLCEETGRKKLSQLRVEEINAAIAQAWEGPRPRGPSEHSPPERQQSIVVDNDVYSCLGARNVVARYQSAGAAGGEPLRKQLEEWKQRLGL